MPEKSVQIDFPIALSLYRRKKLVNITLLAKIFKVNFTLKFEMHKNSMI